MIIAQKQTQTNEELFIEAYEIAFPKVASFVKKLGGTFEETKDIFQGALVIYYEKKIVAGQHSKNGESAYIVGIARLLWYKKYHQTKLNRSIASLPDLKEADEEPKVSETILRFVELSGKKCLELLKSFYYDKLSMKDVSEKFGFSGERSATAQKFKCL